MTDDVHRLPCAEDGADKALLADFAKARFCRKCGQFRPNPCEPED